MKQTDRSKLVLRISLLLCLVSAVVVSLEVFSYLKQEKERTVKAKNNGKQEAVRAKKETEKKLRRLQVTANSLASDLSSGKLKDKQLLERMKRNLEDNINFLEIGVAYQPFAFNSKRLYAPFYHRNDGKIKLNQVENYYDYSQLSAKSDWYFKTLENGPIWLEPSFDISSNTILAEYHTVFYRNDNRAKEKKRAGVIYTNYSIDQLNQFFSSLDLGKSGYGVLLSKKGTILVHPNREYVKNQKNIFELASEVNSQQLRIIGEKAIQGETSVIDFTIPTTGQPAWVFIEPVSLTGWSLFVVIIKEDSAEDQLIRRQQLIRIVLETIAFLFFLSVIVFRGYQGSVKSLWAVVVSFSFCCMGGIGLIWHLVWSGNSYKNTLHLLLSKPMVNKFLESNFKLAKKLDQKPPISIPTGVFIQTIKFNSSSDISMTGYIWQKYYNGVHDGVERGFILPEGSDDLEINEVSRTKRKDYELIGWYFKGNLRQTFNFSSYPFDYNDIWVRIWPKAFKHQQTEALIVLTPDFSSYELLNPIEKPGLLDKIASENWLIESSFFQYQYTDVNTNFGDEEAGFLKNYPDLYFTIILKRGLIGILIARIIPLSVVAILLFILLLLCRENSMEVVGACGGLIFILIVDQIGLREQIAASGIVYLEYVYFI